MKINAKYHSKPSISDIKSLEHYMFTANHIMDLCDEVVERNEKKNKMNTVKANNGPKHKNDIFFIPKEKDTLFWCYYILINGLSNYEMLFNNTFKEEKEQKINFIEKLRNHKDILKKYKFKKTELENDLAYNNIISIKTFFAMCAINNKNIALLKNNCLFTLISNESDEINIVQIKDNRYGCLLLDKSEKQKLFKEYTGRYWLIENISKPISAQSTYKLKQLQEIAMKLKIPLINENGKKLRKIDLYNLIKLKVN